MRRLILVITALAGVGLLVGLGILIFGSPDQAVRVPWSGLLAAAVTTVAGAIYLQAVGRPAPAGRKFRSALSTLGFAMLVVIVLVLIGFLITHH